MQCAPTNILFYHVSISVIIFLSVHNISQIDKLCVCVYVCDFLSLFVDNIGNKYI